MLIIRTLIFIFLITLSCFLHATAQEPDYIMIAGKEYELNTNPLEKYLEGIKWEPPKEAMIWSSNWRGYIASWEIKNGELFLNDVTIRIEGKEKYKEEERSIISDLFLDRKPVLASWYSGALVVPDGELVNYVHMGYGSTYERYQVLRITHGKVINHLNMKAIAFEQYKSEKFGEFSKTTEFKKAYEEFKKEADDMNHDDLIQFMRSFYAEKYLAM